MNTKRAATFAVVLLGSGGVSVAQSAPGDAPAEVVHATGPQGTSGEQRYDAVGLAGVQDEAVGAAADQVSIAHPTLPLGAFVEVTSLDSGRTIVALVGERGPGAADRLIDLSRGAAGQLGAGGVTPVRVRLITPPPSDQIALRQGHAASARIDAPPVLLVALRKRLPVPDAPPRSATAHATQPYVVTAPRPVARPKATPAAELQPRPATEKPKPQPKATTLTVAAHGTWFVQVAALSSGPRAKALAASLGGRVEQGGAVYRVQVGPFSDAKSAQRARDDMGRRGYGDARIVHTR